MKANELRIGNLLFGEPVSIPNLGYYSDGVIAISAYGIHMIDVSKLSNFEPIPISEEWLIKLGFQAKKPYHWFGNDADYQPTTNITECWDYVLNDSLFFRIKEWRYRKDGSEAWAIERGYSVFRSNWYEKCHEDRIWCADIKYVHQLQNLCFVLTGLELNVNLK